MARGERPGARLRLEKRLRRDTQGVQLRYAEANYAATSRRPVSSGLLAITEKDCFVASFLAITERECFYTGLRLS